MQAGTLNLQPQGAAGSAHVIIGDATTGVFNQTGGTVDFAPANASANNFFYVGITNSGTLDITGGTFTADSTQSGGIQWRRAAAGTVSIGGGAGTALVDTPLLNFGLSSAGTGTLNLYTNGTLLTSKISVTSGTNTANFDGGTLEAKSSTTTFLSGLTTAVITNNGLTVDTNGFNITIAQALSGVGGPTKRNSGTLTLSGANTYTGATTVANGTLSINTVDVSTNAQSLGKGGTLNLGVAGISSGILQYTGTGGTLDKAVNALGNGLDSIQNTGGGLLTLSGTMTNNGTSVTLGGTGAITVGGTITGTGTGNSNLIDADTAC